VNGFVPPGDPPVLIRIVGNPNFQDEREIAYEAGYRAQITDRVSLDFAAYYNSYDQLETTEPEPSFFETTPRPLHVVMPLNYENLIHGETHGVEIFGTWKVSSRWTLTPACAFEEIHMHLDPGSKDTTTVAAVQGDSPRQWARVDSHLILATRLSWDASANFVGRLANPSVASYTVVNTQLTWNVKEHLSASLVGQNLVRNQHIEFLSEQGTGFTNYIKRSAYAKLTWRF
jgi:iron complex outermembrane receptor protein